MMPDTEIGDKPSISIKWQSCPRIGSHTPTARLVASFCSLDRSHKRRQHPQCRHIVERLLVTSEATADDCISFGDGNRRRAFVGAAFASLRRAGVAIGAGWVPSTVPRNHCRPVVRWLLADAAVARQWCADPFGSVAGGNKGTEKPGNI